MSQGHNNLMGRLPSLRALYIFEVAARHLNLVRASEEIGLTQGALSRHIQTLERHFGVPLFVRTPRGLRLTEAGDMLWTYTQRAFSELRTGLSLISCERSPRNLLVAVARSYATRVLCHRIASFVETYPWINLVLDGHRHLADLTRGEADVAIRVGDGKWSDAESEKIEDDPLFPVASPNLLAKYETHDVQALVEATTLLQYVERPYWETWCRNANVTLPRRALRVGFSETVMMLEAAEAGQGIAIARRSLVREAIATRRLVQLSQLEVDDGIGYYFCATTHARRKEMVKRFHNWIFA